MRLLLIFLSLSIQAMEIHCVHTQVCNLLKETVGNKHTVKMLFQPHSDHHHGGLSIRKRKLIKRDKVTFLPPTNIYSWVKKISNKNIVPLKITKEMIKTHKGISSHDLAFFWLNQEISCSLKKQIAKRLDLPTTCKAEKIDFKNTINAKAIYIATHSPIASLLKSSGAKTFSLSGNHHHSHLSSHSIKHLINVLKKNKNAIWIIEAHEKRKLKKLKKYIRPTDKILYVDAAGSFPQSSTYVLEQFQIALKEVR